MPFYEYQCQACGAQVEVMQKITDAPLKKCPDCGKSRLTKLVSAPVFRLKGGGWYETDFKSDKENKRNLVESEKAESKSEEKTVDKAESKVESKAEPKAESKSEPKAAAKTGSEPARKGRAKPTIQPVKKAVPKRKARR
jgi:putative FmdB family regulatory protein